MPSPEVPPIIHNDDGYPRIRLVDGAPVSLS